MGILFKLLKPSLDLGSEKDIDELLKRPNEIKSLIQNLVSYVAGNTEDFPQIVEHIMECQMSPLQKDNFLSIKAAESRIRNFKFKYPVYVPAHRAFNAAIRTAQRYIRTRRASNFCYPSWAGILLTREELHSRDELEKIQAVLEDKLDGASASLIVGFLGPPSPADNRYIVVDREGLNMTSEDDSKEVTHLKQGETFVTRPNGISNREAEPLLRGWKVKFNDIEGWITFPPNKERIDVVVRANTHRPDKLMPKGWIDKRDFEGQLETYSQKFFAVLQNISTHFEGKHAIFSFFKTRGGLYLMGTFLEMCGISYRLYTGDENDEQRTQILTEYNSPDNKDGGRIKVLLFSFAGSEGMNLTAVQHLHILETDLREGRARQVIGRSARYKSHTILPLNKQKVNVWRYWSVTSFNKEEDRGIDRELYNKAQLRYEAIEQVLNYFEHFSIEKTSQEEDRKYDLEEVKPSVPSSFKSKTDETIRYNLNRLLYWNYYLLTKRKTRKRLWKAELKEFRNSLVFGPPSIFQIEHLDETTPRVMPLKYQDFRRKKKSYLNRDIMSQQIIDQSIFFLKNIQKQKYDSELMRLFPIILDELKEINEKGFS